MVVSRDELFRSGDGTVEKVSCYSPGPPAHTGLGLLLDPQVYHHAHELLAHTPHEHVEEKSGVCKSKLEELSRYVKNL